MHMQKSYIKRFESFKKSFENLSKAIFQFLNLLKIKSIAI